MINPALHKNPTPLDRDRHRRLKLEREAVDLGAMASMNSYFINAVEFADACLEYPVVFVRAGDSGAEGKAAVVPVVAFGLVPGENLFIEHGRWTSQYVPAHLRVYPFAIARTSDTQYAICIDSSCAAVGEAAGTPLFEADGTPSAYLADVQKYLEMLEMELARTRAFCDRLVELGLLQDMRFDATLPDGNTLVVDGFLALDEKKFAELSDATVLELHKSGMLGLLHAHQVSLRNMRRLLDRRLRKTAAA